MTLQGKAGGWIQTTLMLEEYLVRRCAKIETLPINEHQAIKLVQ